MSGNILVSAGSGRRTLLRLVLSLAGTAAAAYLLWPVAQPLLERVHVEPMWGIENMTAIARSALMAVGAYVVFSLLSYCFERLLPDSGEIGTLPWRVESETLTLGEVSIPLENIRKVHCWPGRNILGQSTGNVVVNIETTGKNQVLRSLDGERAHESEAALEELVRALGYGAAWDAAIGS